MLERLHLTRCVQPASNLINGLIRGFLTEADALGPDGVTPGSWMYFNFTATTVTDTGPQLDAPPLAELSISLAVSPSPFRSSVSIDYSLTPEGQQ